jgi:hypothetical protein
MKTDVKSTKTAIEQLENEKMQSLQRLVIIEERLDWLQTQLTKVTEKPTQRKNTIKSSRW